MSHVMSVCPIAPNCLLRPNGLSFSILVEERIANISMKLTTADQAAISRAPGADFSGHWVDISGPQVDF